MNWVAVFKAILATITVAVIATITAIGVHASYNKHPYICVLFICLILFVFVCTFYPLYNIQLEGDCDNEYKGAMVKHDRLWPKEDR